MYEKESTLDPAIKVEFEILHPGPTVQPGPITTFGPMIDYGSTCAVSWIITFPL
jgi:hypothetical protein